MITTPQERIAFVRQAHAAKRALLHRRARSVATGNIGVICDGFIHYESGKITHSMDLRTDAGVEKGLTMDKLVFLDGDATGDLPALTGGTT